MPEFALVRMNGTKAGVLMRDAGVYYFAYDRDYIDAGGHALSLSLPIQLEPFESPTLFPYFDGLVAEGWLRRVQSQFQKIDDKDHFTLLINNGVDLAGAISVEPLSVSEADYGNL